MQFLSAGRWRAGRGKRVRRWLVAAAAVALVAGGSTYALLRPLAGDDAWRMGAWWTDAAASANARHVPRHGRRRTGARVVRGRARVIDGDSLRVSGVEVRLHGIDAPEYRQTCRDARGRRYACGRRAKAHLRRLTGWREVVCRRVTTDRYGRMVAVCKAHGRDIGQQMVRDGWAVAFVRYSRAYVRDERLARQARRGLWQGRFVLPWQWRRHHGRR